MPDRLEGIFSTRYFFFWDSSIRKFGARIGEIKYYAASMRQILSIFKLFAIDRRVQDRIGPDDTARPVDRFAGPVTLVEAVG